MVLWFSMFGLSGWINSGGDALRASAGCVTWWSRSLLAFVTSAVAIGVQFVALLKEPHRFDVIQKTDPKAKKTSLATMSVGSPVERGPVVVIPDPVDASASDAADLSRNAADGR